MNRLVSIGLAIALAPALLLGYGMLSGDALTVEIASAALFRLCLPIAAVLVAAGVLMSAARGVSRVPAAQRMRARVTGVVRARFSAVPSMAWAALAVAVVAFLVLMQWGPHGGLHGTHFGANAMAPALGSPRLWIAVDLVVSFLALVWMLATRRIWGTLPFLLYWLATLAVGLLALSDRPHGGGVDGVLAYVSALVLSQPWTWAILSASILHHGDWNFSAPWIGIALNQVLLGLIALPFPRRSSVRAG